MEGRCGHPIVSLDQWTESTNNGNVKQNLKDGKYLSNLMEPALQRAARHRTPQIAILGPGFFNSSFGQETPTKAEKQDEYQFGKVKTVSCQAVACVQVS